MQASQASAEPLGAAATMPKLALSAKKALIGATGPHVYRFRSTLCALSKAALVGGCGGPKISKPLSAAPEIVREFRGAPNDSGTVPMIL